MSVTVTAITLYPHLCPESDFEKPILTFPVVVLLSRLRLKSREVSVTALSCYKPSPDAGVVSVCEM